MTLVNTTPEAVDLSGWLIADKNKKRSPIGDLAAGPGEAVKVVLDGSGAQLGNQGGIITLLDPQGLKVDGVAYTKAQVSRQGWTVVF